MKTIQLKLPEKLAAEMKAYVEAGWFGSEAEMVRAALMEFIRRNRMGMLERYMREDLQWARKLKGSAA